MSKIFDSSGYISYDYMKEKALAFNFLIAARGTGKTYMMKQLYEDRGPLLYVRRKDIQLQKAMDAATTPFKAVFGEQTFTEYKKNYGKVWKSKDSMEENEPPMINAIAMNTFTNLTGIDFQSTSTVVFDEFIAQKGERPIKHEFQAYKNIMELVYRNHFEKKVQTWFLGNSNTISSNIIIGYRLVSQLYKMYQKRDTVWRDVDRGIAIFLVFDSPISSRKAENAFYQSIGASKAGMELSNTFADMSTEYVRHQNIKEFKQDIKTPGFSIWKHKVYDLYYCTKNMKAGAIYTYANSASSLDAWQRYGRAFYYQQYLRGKMLFSSYDVQTDFLYSFDCETWNNLLTM